MRAERQHAGRQRRLRAKRDERLRLDERRVRTEDRRAERHGPDRPHRQQRAPELDLFGIDELQPLRAGADALAVRCQRQRDHVDPDAALADC